MKAKVCLQKATSLLVAAAMLIGIPTVQASADDRVATPEVDFAYTQSAAQVSTTGGEVELYASLPGDVVYRAFNVSVNYEEAVETYGCTVKLESLLDEDVDNCNITKDKWEGAKNKPSHFVRFSDSEGVIFDTTRNVYKCTLTVPADLAPGTKIKILANENMGIAYLDAIGEPHYVDQTTCTKYANNDFVIWSVDIVGNGKKPTPILGVDTDGDGTPDADFQATGADTGKLIFDQDGGPYEYYINNGGQTTTDSSENPLTGLQKNDVIHIRAKGDGVNTSDSDWYDITVGKKATPTSVAATGCMTATNNNGKITGVNDKMEWQKHITTGSWTSIGSGKTAITDLTPDTYYVRMKATGVYLASDPVATIINPYGISMEPTPNSDREHPDAIFEATDEAEGDLTVATAGRYVYKIGDEETWHNIEGTTVHLTDLTKGSVIMVVRKGDGAYTLDSNPGTITIQKAYTPETTAVACTNIQQRNGKIIHTSDSMQYRKKGETNWISVGGSTIAPLAAGEYEIRVAPKGTTLASFPQTVIVAEYGSQKEETPIAADVIFTATSDNEGTLAVKKDGFYQCNVNGGIWTEITNDAPAMLAGLCEGDIIYIEKEGDGIYTLDSEPLQIIVGQEPMPTGATMVACTTLQQNDGQIRNVDNTMEYRKAYERKWHPITGDAILNLEAGRYEVRTKAKDQNLASFSQPVVVQAYVGIPEPTPTDATFTATSDHEGTLKVKEANLYKYSVKDKDGVIKIAEKDIPAGTTIDNLAGLAEDDLILVIRKGDGVYTVDSEPLQIIVGRKATPTWIKPKACTTLQQNDGQIQEVSDKMEWCPEGESTWIPVPTGTDAILNLEAGEYEVRMKAEGQDLASFTQPVFLEEYPGVKNPTPNMDPEQGEVSVTFTATDDSTGTLDVDATNEYKYSINSEEETDYIDITGNSVDLTDLVKGDIIRVIKKGDEVYTLDSDPTPIVLDQEATPTDVEGVACTTPRNDDGQLTGLTEKMEYRKAGDTDWIPVPEGATTITDLTAGEYEVRVKANGLFLASHACYVIIEGSGIYPVPTISVMKFDSNRDEYVDIVDIIVAIDIMNDVKIARTAEEREFIYYLFDMGYEKGEGDGCVDITDLVHMIDQCNYIEEFYRIDIAESWEEFYPGLLER